MTKLVVIIGPNGVGKSTTSEALLNILKNCAYVDADWCRCINPFALTAETKKVVIENIYCLFKNYIMCKAIDVVVFPYGFHGERKAIFDKVISKLRADGLEFDLHIIILKCSLDENIRRARLDNRNEERIKRGIDNTFYFYDEFDAPCIDTTNMSPQQAALKILDII